MIVRIKNVDDDTVSAIGPRFDLDKVLEVSLGIIRTLSRRSDMRFGDTEAPTFAFCGDDAPRPFDDESFDRIAAGFKECRETKYDVTLYSCEVRFGPFMADLYLMGLDCLHGPIGNCVTDRDLDWRDLDPTPVMLVMMSRGMIDPIIGAHRDFLAKTLDSYAPQGIVWEPFDETREDLAFIVSFPHEAFGVGRGSIRICRYLHKSLREKQEEP